MRIHLLAPPNAPTETSFYLDGFIQATLRFNKLLKDAGHEVYLYGNGCSSFLDTITWEEQKMILNGASYHIATADNFPKLWEVANRRAIEYIRQTKQPGDIICHIGGIGHKAVSDAFPDIPTVEWSIGYEASYAPFRIFESNAWRHATYGMRQPQRFFDDTIPLFFDSAQFPFRREKKGYALFVGRLTPAKGLHIACRAAKEAGIPLKVIGDGDRSLVIDGAEYIGAVDDNTKAEYMADASVLICPTQYTEPFGSVAVEAQLCGTPVVSTDWGGFTETVEHGVTGFRCHYLGEFVAALKKAPRLNPDVIVNRALHKYSMATATVAYNRYFYRLRQLWNEGWYSLNSVNPL